MTDLIPHPGPRMALGALEDPRELGTVLAASGYFADVREAAQAVVKVLAGMELGFGPIASMTGIYIVKGRVTIGANLIAAAVKRNPKYDFRIADLTNELASVKFFEHNGTEWQHVGTSEFSMDDARTAGLAGGENWRKYPRNMLLWRAMSNGAKFFCPDVFAGAPIYTPDELGADVDPETGEIVGAQELPASSAPRTTESAPADALVAPVPAGGTPTSGASEPAPEDTPASGGAGMSLTGGADEAPTTVANGTPTAVPLSAPPGENAADPVTPQELESLGQVLDGLGAPESFLRMALMSAGKTELSELTRGEAFDVLARANARFGG